MRGKPGIPRKPIRRSSLSSKLIQLRERKGMRRRFKVDRGAHWLDAKLIGKALILYLGSVGV